MRISEAMKQLSKYGLEPVGGVVSLNQALKLEKPIVLKLDSAEHKTEKGLVFVGLRTDQEIISAFKKIAEHGPVLAQPVVSGLEMILGVNDDSVFGKVIMLGAGGIMTEIMDDTAFRAVPVSDRDIELMLTELRIAELVQDFRGIRPNKKALIRAVKSVSRFSEKNEFSSLDINPLIINSKGAWAIDVRVIK
ncbi:MAG: hypothetical protein GOU99_02810 [Candidatus Altiarchaeota archaeon]|nr:hypothetical protein [Candidatus Altiarchaeota archaeon]